MSQSELCGATIEEYLASIRSVHVDRNHDILVFENAHLKRIIQGAKYLFPQDPVRAERKPPISKDKFKAPVSPESTVGKHHK